MIYPPVRHYGDIHVEPFETYYERWPSRLSAIPRPIVEDWIYRHWSDFKRHWMALAPHTWRYELRTFTSAEVLSIGHVSTWISDLDAEGVEYVSGFPRGRTRMAQFMLEHGTFPVPILVAQGAGHVVHPRSANERMKEPFQLIEGHSRLACIRGMINAQYSTLAPSHRVWVANIPEVV